ncbi:twin-arginine translocase TatA/TatE family subunit [Myxococcota bacterium]|nr:twin-arginine translocase TatA/TatE family subunit [Myxococcota bacterium]
MFGLGIWEIFLIGVIALIVLGPRRIPELANQLGRAFRELRNASNELKSGLVGPENGLKEEIQDVVKQSLDDVKTAVTDPVPSPPETKIPENDNR